MSTYPIIAPKKLIEVALPLDAINKACAREKSIRHGHPSTLHLWWARRPLAAARAVLFAQLVNDPSWKYSAEELKKNQVKGAITKKRNELFRLITELVQWENTTNEKVLELARKEIRASWRETCEANKDHPDAKTLFDPEKLPAFHDPFAGGGSIPLEAQRLGLEAHASDLNPVAVLINKAMIEIPPKFAGRPPVGPVPKAEKQTKGKATEDWSGARGLAEDVRRYGAWMREEAEKRIGHLYPKVKITKAMVKERPDLAAYEGRELTVIAWLWARTVKSPSPAFASAEVPLVSSCVLASRPGKEAWVEPVITKDRYRFAVRIGNPTAEASQGTRATGRGANFVCLFSKSPITGDYIKSEAQAGRMGTRLLALVAEGDRGRVYLSPDDAVGLLAGSAQPRWQPDVEFFQKALGFRVGNYGMTRWSDLFTQRQLVALETFASLVREAASRIYEDFLGASGGDAEAASAYRAAISLYLSFAVSRMANYSSSLCVWSSHPKDELAKQVFGRQTVQMTWDFAETNPFSAAGGTLETNLSYLCKAVAVLPATGRGVSIQSDARVHQENESAWAETVVSCDPPYYDNVGYADLSDFFYVWLRYALAGSYGELLSTISTPKAGELVATPDRHGGRTQAEAFFLDGMSAAMRRIAAESHPALPITVYYAFRQSETEADSATSSTGWAVFLAGILQAGLGISGTWPVRTEYTGNLKTKRNALASSVILVCRARPDGAGVTARKDFLRELERVLPQALTDMTADPEAFVAPVDLAQAAIGPGMAVLSKYQAVLEADGSPMSVHSALVHINRSIDDFFAQADGNLDADTRFCVGWFQQYGFEVGPFGEADVLARAKGASVDGMRDAGILETGKGRMRLVRARDLMKRSDPANDSRVPVWKACHQMCRELAESEATAGALLAQMPAKQDAIRQLAYRLYTICERQKWTEEARAYNELVASWPAIVEESHKVGHVGTQLELPGGR
jgi:putative DNA methylase